MFESRNREYGAYSIRKSYHENLSKASLIALLFVAFVFGVIQVASLLRMKIEIAPPKITIPEIIFPPVIIPDPPTFKQEIKSIKKSNPDFFPIATTQEPVEAPPNEPLNTLPVGSETGIDETPTGGVVQGSDVETTFIVVKPREILNGAEVMPQYEGGLKAMARFISKNMNYPASARVTGQEGTVYVRFVVNSEGKIVDVEVLTGASAVLDREAMRVVALMSKWKPGMQHNIPVNVRMVLPIKFQLEQ